MPRCSTIVIGALVAVVTIGFAVVVRHEEGSSAPSGTSSSAGGSPLTPSSTVFTTTSATVSTPATDAPAPTTAAARAPSAPVVPALTAESVVEADGPDDECPGTDHGAIVDRVLQRGWLCDEGRATGEFPITSADSMPDPGTYPVYAKDLDATSSFGGHESRMTHFVAFTYGKRTHARIAFHTVPTLDDGSFVQPLASVGDLVRRGESSGCIRVLPAEAEVIWDWLSIGDAVRVVS